MFRRLFEELVRQCVEKGLVSGKLMATNSTHVKANASQASEEKVDVQQEAGNYWERLDAYEEEGLEELGIDFFVIPQPAHDRTKAELKRDAFTYDEHRDVYLCPSGKALHRKHLYRSGSGLFWEYWAGRADCPCCLLRDRCLSETDKAGTRKLQDSYFKPSVQRHFARRREPEYQEALTKRQIWCEGTFTAQKWGHNLTRVL